MKAKTATLAGAAVALAAAPAMAAVASAPAVPVAASYADLLTPIPDAQARLQRADLQETQAPALLIKAQYHHHHHHHHARGWYMQHGYSWFGGRWVLRPRHHHHHHHHY